MTTRKEVNAALIPLVFGIILMFIGIWLGGLLFVGFFLIGLALMFPMLRLTIEDMEGEKRNDERK